jgi:hypothetical protein
MVMSGEQIYRNFTEARGSDPLANAAAEVRKLVDEYNLQADEIVRLTRRMEAAWQGDAAGAAQRGAGPLAVAHLYAAPRINTSQDLSTRQVESFGAARSAVRPVPPAPERPDPWSMIFSLDVTSTYAGQVTAHQAAAQHNVDVMSRYESASAFNAGGQPNSYGSIAPDSATVVVLDQPSGGTASPPRAPGGHHPTSDIGSDVPTSDPISEGGNEPRPPDEPHVAPSNDQPTDTSHDSQTVVPGTAHPETPTVGPQWTGSADEPPGNQIVGAQPERPPIDAARPDDARTGAGKGDGSPGVGADSRVIKDDRNSGRLSRGEGRALGGEAGAGRGLSPPGGENVSARGVPPSAKGGIPVAPTAAGKGRGGEDDEHRRASFLQEADPESVFGTDERSTPPVIE